MEQLPERINAKKLRDDLGIKATEQKGLIQEQCAFLRKAISEQMDKEVKYKYSVELRTKYTDEAIDKVREELEKRGFLALAFNGENHTKISWWVNLEKEPGK